MIINTVIAIQPMKDLSASLLIISPVKAYSIRANKMLITSLNTSKLFIRSSLKGLFVITSVKLRRLVTINRGMLIEEVFIKKAPIEKLMRLVMKNIGRRKFILESNFKSPYREERTSLLFCSLSGILLFGKGT